MKSIGTLLGALVSAALMLPVSAAMAQGKTGIVKIGVNETLSGTWTSVGLPATTAVRLAVREINEKGFRVGDTTYKFDLIVVDNKSESAASVAAMVKLVEDDKVKFVIGPVISAVANPAQEVSVPANVIHFSGAGSWQTLGYLSDPKKPLLFGTQLPLDRIAKIDVDGLRALGAKKIAYISADDDTTKGNIGPFLAEAKAAGIEVVTILFPPNTTDFSSVVTRAKGEKVDAIYFLQPQPSVPDLLRAISELSAGGKGFGGRNLSPDVALKLAVGKPLSFPFFASMGMPSFDYPPNAKAKAYVDRMKGMGVNLGNSGHFGLLTYDFVGMLVAAMTKAGTVDDTAKIAAALSSMSYDGVAGKVCFGAKMRNATYDGGQVFVRDGKVESRAYASDCK